MSSRTIGTGPAVLAAAAVLAVGLASPAAAHEVHHMISGSTIANHSIAGKKLKTDTVTGRQVKESTLGTVPSAKTAFVASHLPRLVMTKATLANGWTSYESSRPVAYGKDAQGVVHLQGTLFDGAYDNTAFTLPVGDRPAADVDLPTVGQGDVDYVFVQTDGEVFPERSGVDPQPGGSGPQPPSVSDLDSVSFVVG